MTFWKVQSVGNHFPLLLADDRDPSALAPRLCDPHFGIGGDGLLTISRGDRDHITLRMFNCDGTEDFCGNGVRCAARWAVDQGWVGDRFTVHHLGRAVAVTVREPVIETVIGRGAYRVRDGRDFFDLPFSLFGLGDGTWRASALSAGSDHLVLWGREPTEAEFRELSPALETHALFPERTSIMWATPHEGFVSLRIWERGVGETWGCGSGATATALDHFRRRMAGGELTVRMRGGEVVVGADRWDGEARLSGVAHVVYRGEWPDEIT